MKLVRLASRLPLAAGLVLLSACGSVYQLEVRAGDKPATVFINGERRGTAPGTFVVNFEESTKIVLQVAHEDYRPERDVINKATFDAEGKKHSKSYILRR